MRSTLSSTILIAGLAALAACSAGEAPAPAESSVAPREEPATPPFDLTGRWRILSIDGRPPAGKAEGERAPVLTFDRRSVGGTVGCNSGGGLGLLADGHYAIHSWASTLIGCFDEVGQQEQAISRMFFARPAVRPSGANRVRIESPDHNVELERIGASQGPGVPGGTEELTNTRWRIVMMDGQEASTSPTSRILRFDAGTWQGLASCATLSGTWRREGDRIMVGPQIATTEQNCPPAMARIDESFADLMRSNPRYLVGPNGELLIAGGGHALAGGGAD